MSPAPRIIRSFTQALGLLGRGKLEQKLNDEMERAIRALQEHPEDKAKATVTVTLTVTKLNDRLDIKPDVKVKLPEEKGIPSTTFWPLDGGLSVQHPSQTDMFAGPRAAGGAEREFA
ncbi:hypothetical protein ABLE91_17070 [Aquabacter sp. CN5-332]|uniref:hypothetical protein n=1 Tax=Aquabacter sp. CN5-332 TaxID=3156608 RepID=UPI0032B38D30